MTPEQAVRDLFDEFNLESVEEIVRDDAKSDPDFDGYSANHPRVLRFREVCATLKDFAKVSV